jgi:iron complex outermembrane recepter protein
VHRAGLLLVACLPALGVRAAEPGAPTQLTEVLSPWIVTDTRLRPETMPVRAGGLMPEQTWSGRAVGTLAEAFRDVPGAIMQESHGGFEPPRISIRGSGLQSAPSSRGVLLLLDRVPFGLADGSFNSALLDPLVADHLEVQRGLDGWRAAPATAGGALDLRLSPVAKPDASLRVEAGSYDAWRVRGAAAAVHDGLGATGGFSLAQHEGFREHNAQKRTVVFGALERAFAPDGQARFGVYHAQLRYEVPGPLTLAAAALTPDSISADVRRDLPRRTSEITRAALSAARGNEAAAVDFDAGFSHTTDELRQLQANGVTASRSDDLYLNGGYTRRFTAGATAHQLRLEGRAARGWREQRRSLNESGQVGALFARDGLAPTTTTLLAEDAFTLAPRLVATAGLARVDARRDIHDRFNVGPTTTQELSTGATLPSASVRWRFARESVAFVSYSTAAEPATFDDLIFVTGAHPALGRRSQRLATQRAATWEIGGRGRSGPLTWDAAVYHAEWHNEILRLADPRGLPRGAVNAGPTTHDGVELSARWLLIERPWRVALQSTAAWTSFTFDDDPVYGQNRLAGVPPHFGTAELTVDFPRGGFGAIGTDWSAGATRVDHAGRLQYGGQALTHVRGGWRYAPYWTIFIEVQNVFDRNTIASTAGLLDLARNPPVTAIFLPAPGRAVTLGVEWRH